MSTSLTSSMFGASFRSDSRMFDFINSKTPSRLRAEAMGFTFSPITVDYNTLTMLTQIRGTYTCGGRIFEKYVLSVDMLNFGELSWSRELDVARRLRQNGAFSREHLLKVGYTEAQVAEIERRGADWDADGQST